MREFAIVTDACAELSDPLARENDIEILPMKLTLAGRVYDHYADYRALPAETFYNALRAGAAVTTSAINMSDYIAALTPLLAAGRDVLLLVFSSGLSSTYQSALLAAEELRAAFPARRIYPVDTLAPSGGEALLAWHAAQLRRAGESIEQVRDWVEQNKLHLAHWFTVDDLNFLKRGGRISAATAVMGTMLSIKPVLHVDNAGKLVSVSKVRGRAAALKALVDHMEQTAVAPGEQTVFLGHGDCLADAERVAADVEARFHPRALHIAYTSPIIGAHSGPGTVALFFLATGR